MGRRDIDNFSMYTVYNHFMITMAYLKNIIISMHKMFGRTSSCTRVCESVQGCARVCKAATTFSIQIYLMSMSPRFYLVSN